MRKIVPKDAVLIPNNAQCVFKGQIFDVYQWPQKMFDGSIETFEMLKRPDTVTVIGIVKEKILVLEESQPNSGLRLSFPGGRVDKGEEPLQAAKREVKEETGYGFESWRLVSVWQPHTKLEWFIYFYIASNGLKIAEPKHDAGEKIEVKAENFDSVKQLSITKAGYLGESKDLIFEKVNALAELMDLPEFEGQEIEA